MAEENDPIESAFSWWARLHGPGGDKGARARLSRGTIETASMEAATMDLAKALGVSSATRLPQVAALAIILASIREHEKTPFGRKIGRKKFGDETSAKLSQLRFMNLMQARDDEALLMNLRRAVAIAKNEANVFDVARLMLFNKSQRVRDNFTLQYYAVKNDVVINAAA